MVTIIVTEGPDLAGKTTFVQNIVANLVNVKTLKQGPPPPPPHRVDILEHYLRPIQNLCFEPMINRPQWLILDRWHVGELFYGPLLRGKSLLTGQQADYIDMVLQTFGCNFTYVTQPTPVLEQRWDLRGDGLIKREWLGELNANYHHWMTQRPHWVCYTESQFDFAGFNESPMAGQYIGPRQPRVLLLGDQRNNHRMIFPFVPERATSGHWLMSALHAGKVNHMDVGIMNACEIEPEKLFKQWHDLHKPPVITLGNNAKKAWEKTVPLCLRHHLNHPQYERRFYHAATERYGLKIKDVMENG